MKDNGFSHLISKNKKQAIIRLQADIDGGTMTRNYDPALHLMWIICHKLTRRTKEGKAIRLNHKPQCPLCVMENLTDKIMTDYYMENEAKSISKEVVKHNLQG